MLHKGCYKDSVRAFLGSVGTVVVVAVVVVVAIEEE